MPQAQDIHGTVNRGSTCTNMRRVTGADAANIVQADISTITYSIFLLDDQEADSRTAVAEHQDVDVAVADTIFDTLQTDGRWTEDATGYNFRHTVDVSSNAAFAVAGRRYLIEYKLTPGSGQVIIVRFRVNVI